MRSHHCNLLIDLRESAQRWTDDNISLHASSVAYYTIFSIAPLLSISLAVAGFLFGEKASHGQIFNEVQGLLGTNGASMIQGMVQSAASHPHSGVFATGVGIIILLVGASSIFRQLQDSLNVIWGVQT